MAPLVNNTLLKLIFFGNYFYGICAVALSIEASLQQHFPLNDALYYVMAGISTVLYYSKAYIKTEVTGNDANERSVWYAGNRGALKYSQYGLIALLAACLLWVAWRHLGAILQLRAYEYALVGVFPLVSVLYYGTEAKGRSYSLRHVGWLKPFVIGFTWAGLVNIYPIVYYNIVHGLHYEVTLIGVLLFIKNFMYITVLCIMFDIKDYAMDYNRMLKTFVVKAGLYRTLFYIIIPLTLLGLASFWTYAFIQHFHYLRIVLNTIPFVLAILVTLSLQRRKSIFYYLVIIDGLMLVKAGCGITAMLFFR